jgi:hypothetical protein
VPVQSAAELTQRHIADLARGIKPVRVSRPTFQVSGRSRSDALERSVTTYRDVVMAAIPGGESAGIDE